MLHQSPPLVGAQYLQNIFEIVDFSFPLKHPVAFQCYRKKKKSMIYFSFPLRHHVGTQYLQKIVVNTQ